jgi:ATP-dependent RNA helicase RhlE
LTFEDFNFDPRLMDGIAALGFTTATPIQEQAIPKILEGRDLIGSAQTGTGKTAAFLLPIIDRILEMPDDHKIKALVVVPTRELAQQIDQHMEGLSYFTPVSSVAVYGGTDGGTFSREKMALEKGADIVICTPGRMIAHLNMGYVNLKDINFLILDEADRMLDMGFHDDILKIISFVPANRQTLCFSATMPPMMRDLARKILRDPFEISIALSKPAANILQMAYAVFETQKIPLVEYLVKSQEMRSILIFCSTKSKTKQVAAALKKLKLGAEEIHSDLEQIERERVLNRFRSKELTILVATDILSRGIDIEDIDLVINFDVPHDGEDYIHRIGRTARAAARGAAITLISETEQRKFQAIEKLLEKSVYKGVVPIQLGPAPEYNPAKFKSAEKRKSFRKKY